MDKKIFFKDAALAFAVRVFGALSGFLMNLIIVRTFSSSESGLFFLAYSLTMILGLLSTLGFTSSIVKFIGAFSSEGNWGIVKGVFICASKYTIITSAIVGALIYVFSYQISIFIFQKEQLIPLIEITSIVIPFYAIYRLMGFAFQGVHKPVFSVFLQNISNQFFVIIVLLVFLFIEFKPSIYQLSLIFLIGAILTALLGCVFWIKRKEHQVNEDVSQNKNLILSAKSLWVVLLMETLVQWSGQIIVGVYVTPEQVAYFSVAQRIAMLTSFILIAVNLVVAPKFAAIHRTGNIEELRGTSILCGRLIFTLALPVVFTLLVFPEFFLSFFGEEYRKASLILQILVIGQFISVISGTVIFLLSMTGHEKDLRNVVLLSGPIALVLGLVLTPYFGTIGAAIATSLSLATQNFFAVYMVKKRLGFNTLNIFKRA